MSQQRVFVRVASNVTGNGTAPTAGRVRREKAFMAGATARPPYSSSSLQMIPLSISRARPPGWFLRATPRTSAYKTASKNVVMETEPTAPEPYMQNDNDYVYMRVPQVKMVPVDNGLNETVQHQVSQSAGHRMQRQFFTLFRCSRRHPRRGRRVGIFRHNFISACFSFSAW